MSILRDISLDSSSLQTESLNSEVVPVFERMWLNVEDASATICRHAMLTILLHASKFPQSHVSGLMLGDGSMVHKVLPLSHTLATFPAIDTAVNLTQAQSFSLDCDCKATGPIQLMGIYSAPAQVVQTSREEWTEQISPLLEAFEAAAKEQSIASSLEPSLQKTSKSDDPDDVDSSLAPEAACKATQAAENMWTARGALRRLLGSRIAAQMRLVEQSVRASVQSLPVISNVDGKAETAAGGALLFVVCADCLVINADTARPALPIGVLVRVATRQKGGVDDTPARGKGDMKLERRQVERSSKSSSSSSSSSHADSSVLEEVRALLPSALSLHSVKITEEIYKEWLQLLISEKEHLLCDMDEWLNGGNDGWLLNRRIIQVINTITK